MSRIASVLHNLGPVSIAALSVLVVLAAHVVPWAIDHRGLRKYPGPWLAQFSDVWLGWTASHGSRCEIPAHNSIVPEKQGQLCA